MPTIPIEKLSYEQARAELVDVVQRLEQGAATLEESLQLWERGEALATRCQTWLDSARGRLRAATEARDESGAATAAATTATSAATTDGS